MTAACSNNLGMLGLQLSMSSFVLANAHFKGIHKFWNKNLDADTQETGRSAISEIDRAVAPKNGRDHNCTTSLMQTRFSMEHTSIEHACEQVSNVKRSLAQRSEPWWFHRCDDEKLSVADPCTSALTSKTSDVRSAALVHSNLRSRIGRLRSIQTSMCRSSGGPWPTTLSNRYLQQPKKNKWAAGRFLYGG